MSAQRQRSQSQFASQIRAGGGSQLLVECSQLLLIHRDDLLQLMTWQRKLKYLSLLIFY